MANGSTASMQPMEAAILFGRYMIEVDMFPLFLISHFAVACLMIREDSKDLGPRFRQNHPFASWMCTILTGLAGNFVINFLFGDPLIDVMKEDKLIICLTIMWYLMNYCPFDLVYKVSRIPLVYVIMAIFQEGLRVRCIYLGLQEAAKVYPGAYTIILLGGAINGNGYGYMKIVERLIRGKWNPDSNEILEVTYFAKSGLYASLLLLSQQVGYLPVPLEILYTFIFAAFIIFRVTITIFPVQDPLLPIEEPVCRLIFGAGDSRAAKAAVNGGGQESKNDKKKQ